MSTPTVSLADAVRKGLAEGNPVIEGTPQNEEPTEEAKETPSEYSETEKEVKKEEDDDLSPDDKKKAFDLLRTLRNPDQAKELIHGLALKSGLIQEAETVKEAKEAGQETVDKILEKVRKHLGEENEWLNPKLAALLKETVSELVADQVKDIREQQVSDVVARNEQIGLTCIKGIEAKYSDVDEKLVNAMTAEIDNYRMAPGMSPEAYFEKLYKLAGGKGTLRKSDPIPIRKTAPDPLSQLGSEGKGSVTQEAPGTQKIDLTTSVQNAIEKVFKRK